MSINPNTKVMSTNNDITLETVIKKTLLSYRVGHAKAAARHALWSGFVLDCYCPFRLDDALDLFKAEGDQWISLVYGPKGLDFRLAEETPRPGEVVILPGIHISEIPDVFLPDSLHHLLKRVYFCTREEASQIRSDYEAEVEELLSSDEDNRLPEPPVLVEVESLPGHEGLMPIDAALR